MVGDLDYCESHEEAIADGLLIDVSKMARELGIYLPVVVSQNVWYICIDADPWEPKQAEEMRLRFILNAMRSATRTLKDGVTVSFSVWLCRGSDEPVLLELKACGNLDDHGGPVISIIFPGKDD